MIHLNGIQAVAYARIRYVGNADYERTNRQRKIMTKLFEKFKSMNLNELTDFADKALPNVTTNMQSDEIWDMITDAFKYLGYDLVSARVPFDDTSTGTFINGMSYLLPVEPWNSSRK